MTSLLSRLQSLTAPDREVDAEIALKAGWTKRYSAVGDCVIWRDADANTSLTPPRYTESLDAALTLVPNGWHPIIDYRDNLDGSSSVVLHEFPQPCRRIPEKPFAIIKESAARALLIAWAMMMESDSALSGKEE